MSTSILGAGSYLPELALSNQDLIDKGLDTSDQWIVSHTGIRSRRIAAPEQATSDLAVAAAREALNAASVRPEDLGYILCATSTPDHKLPATANIVQHKLGASCGASDVNSGCSGFVQALLLGWSLCDRLKPGPVLVIGADAYSRILDWSDRRTAVFFGDGAGAVVLGDTASEPRLLGSVSGSDGSGASLLVVPAGGSRKPTTTESLAAQNEKLFMDGRRVWDFAVDLVPRIVRSAVAQSGLTLDQVDLIIPHQANERMLGVVAQELGVSEDVVFARVRDHANTAAASIPIALVGAIHEGRLKRGDVVVLAGFGAGLSWSAVCIRY